MKWLVCLAHGRLSGLKSLGQSRAGVEQGKGSEDGSLSMPHASFSRSSVSFPQPSSFF